MWSLPDAELASAFLDDWCDRVYDSKLRPLIDTLDSHWDDMLRWFQTRISNGVLEAINSLIQAAKRRARGYRTDTHYIAMIYMTAGKLNFGLPSWNNEEPEVLGSWGQPRVRRTGSERTDVGSKNDGGSAIATLCH